MALNYEVKREYSVLTRQNRKVRGADENFGCGRF